MLIRTHPLTKKAMSQVEDEVKVDAFIADEDDMDARKPTEQKL